MCIQTHVYISMINFTRSVLKVSIHSYSVTDSQPPLMIVNKHINLGARQLTSVNQTSIIMLSIPTLLQNVHILAYCVYTLTCILVLLQDNRVDSRGEFVSTV